MDTVKYLIVKQHCNPSCQDSDGDTPLHHAAGYGKTAIVEYLVTKHQCDPQVKKRFLKQPLHWACKNGHMDTVKYLTEEQHCTPSCQDSDGNTPLHFAAGHGKTEIVEYLVTKHQCDLQVKNKFLNQPLHWACENGHMDTVKYLTEEQHCNPSCQNIYGTTPLHFAAGFGKTEIVDYLITKHQCDPRVKNRFLNQPLHWACENGHMDTVKYLTEEKHCNPSCQNIDESTPLHFAAGHGKTEIVEYLLTKHQCDPQVKNRLLNEPLHWACQKGHMDTVKYLIEEQKCDPAFPTVLKTTPLGLAFENNHLEIIHYIVTGNYCKVNAKLDKDDNSSLHLAADKGYLDIIKHLATLKEFDVTVKNIHGSHPLHFACRSGNENMVQYLLSHKKTNTTKKNKHGYTPMMCAANRSNSSQLLSLFAFFGQSKSAIQIDKFVKVGILGHIRAGKTTLANVIAEQGKANLSSQYRKFFAFDVPKVEDCTAGIIPSIVRSEKFGTIIVHDFAGHPEYYSSHTAILETLCCNSSVVIVIVVDISDQANTIQHLRYWLIFIKQEIDKIRGEVYIIVIGSHKDQIDPNTRKGTHLEIHRTASELMKEFEGIYVGFVSMDCRKLWSKELMTFLNLLSESCHQIQSKSQLKNISIYCHILYLFLLENTEIPYCTLLSLKYHIKRHDSRVHLPTDSSELSPYLQTLEEIGLVFFIVNKNDIDQSWIIVHKELILSEVNGVLFAPTTFTQYRSNLASNTGVVTESMLKQHFSQFDSQMLISFLIKMELCRELEPSVLKVIINNLTNVHNDQLIGKILFFPALVHDERQDKADGVFDFGLLFQCSQSWQFSISFLQALQLNLAYKYALPNEAQIGPSECSMPAGISRKCCVWKNGILWINQNGIKTVVEVTNHCKTLLLLMAQISSTARLSSFACLRSKLIKEILDLLKSFCPSLKFTESILHPGQLQSYPKNTKILHSFNIVDVFKSFVNEDKCVVNENGEEKLDFCDIRPKEPYFSLYPQYIKQLFDDSNTRRTIPSVLSGHIQSRCGQLHVVSVKEDTYESVRRLLDNVSIFGGRNPFVVAKVDPNSIPPFPHSISNQTLTIDDLSEVLLVLENVIEWHQLGLCLGLKETALETVENDFRKVLDAKREMLKIWLKQDAQATAAESGATWKSLIIALRKMNQHVLAKRIVDEYTDDCGEQDCTSETVEGPALQLVSIEKHTYETAVAKVDLNPIPSLSHAMGKSRLSVDDLEELLFVLEDVTEWHQLGLHLGLKETALRTVECEFRKLLDAKREMLKIWLEKNAQVTTAGSRATCNSLIIALGKMSHDKVAKMIKDKYMDGCRKQDCSSVAMEGPQLQTVEPAPESAED